MKPYENKNCKCHLIEYQIKIKYPNASWNGDEACGEWRMRREELKDNDIEFDENDDGGYGCTCPTCGRVVCGGCV